MRVLHAPTTVGGNPASLSYAERKLGIDSKTVTIHQNYINYRADVSFGSDSSLIRLLRQFWWGIWEIRKYDVVHYNFGSSFFPARLATRGKFVFLKRILNIFLKHIELLDVRFAHMLGKKIVVTFQGDDARQGDYCRTNYAIHFVNFVSFGYYSAETDQWKRERIQKFSQATDYMFALNPDLLNVLPSKAKFLPYANVNPHEWNYIGTQTGNFIPHIVHAPSNKEVKGSQFIIDAVKQLQAEGVEFKFTLVEGLSNLEAKKIYESADLLVDQLLAGFYGGLSVELMSLGKPVVCYLREEDMSFLPKEMNDDLPIINANPDTIYEVLKRLLGKKDEWYSIGQKSRKFVENWHDPEEIAKILIETYKR